jgi:hypothetical protein
MKMQGQVVIDKTKTDNAGTFGALTAAMEELKLKLFDDVKAVAAGDGELVITFEGPHIERVKEEIENVSDELQKSLEDVLQELENGFDKSKAGWQARLGQAKKKAIKEFHERVEADAANALAAGDNSDPLADVVPQS